MPPWPEELELPARKLRLDTLLALLVRLPHIGIMVRSGGSDRQSRLAFQAPGSPVRTARLAA